MKVSGTISPLPLGADVEVSVGTQKAKSDASGKYSVDSVGVGSHTATASKSGASFDPPSRSVTVTEGKDVTGVDFKAKAEAAGAKDNPAGADVGDAGHTGAAGARREQETPGDDFDIAGWAGGGFNIRGTGFSSSGTVTLNGQQLKTTAWGDMLIKGEMPADAKSGEVVVDSGGRIQKATFRGGVRALPGTLAQQAEVAARQAEQAAEQARLAARQAAATQPAGSEPKK